MKVLLVYPPVFRTVNLANNPLPIGMLQVARCLLDAGHDVQALNLEIGGEIRTISIRRMRQAYAETDIPTALTQPSSPWQVTFKRKLAGFKPDIVAFSTATEQLDAAAQLATIAQRMLPDVRIEYGGAHAPHSEWAWKLSTEALHCDPALEMLVGQNPPASFGAILTSLGCPFDCTFCGSPERYGRKLNAYPINQVHHRIEQAVAAGATQIHLMDDTITLKRERALEIASLMNHVALPWRTQTRVDDLGRHPDLATIFKDSGCTQLTFGVESGSPRVLQAIRKRITPEQVLKAVDIINAADLAYTANFMIGFPGETDDDVQQTLDLIEKMKPSRILAGSVVPYPNTALHRDNPAFVEAARRWPYSQWSPFNGDFLTDDQGNRIQGPSRDAQQAFFDVVEKVNDHHATPGTFSTVSMTEQIRKIPA